MAFDTLKVQNIRTNDTAMSTNSHDVYLQIVTRYCLDVLPRYLH